MAPSLKHYSNLFKDSSCSCKQDAASWTVQLLPASVVGVVYPLSMLEDITLSQQELLQLNWQVAGTLSDIFAPIYPM